MSHARCFINIPNIRRRYYTPHIVTYHFHRIHHHCSTLGIVLPTIQGISYTSAVHPIIQRNQRKPTTAAHPHQCDLYIIRLFLVSARHASLGRAGGGAAYRQMIASLAWDGRSMTSWISSSWPSPPSTTSSATGLPTVSAGAINGHSLSWWQLASYALLTASCCINSGVWGALVLPAVWCCVPRPLARRFAFIVFIVSLSFYRYRYRIAEILQVVCFGTVLSYRYRTINTGTFGTMSNTTTSINRSTEVLVPYLLFISQALCLMYLVRV